MILVTSNKAKRLLFISYIDVVTPEELEENRAEMEALLAELPADFRLVGDFSSLTTMEDDCEAIIGRMMETIDQHGVELVVRVMPDATKDIGMNILTLFHYSQRPRVATCANLTEAARALAL